MTGSARYRLRHLLTSALDATGRRSYYRHSGLVTDHINAAGNAIASVRPSVRLFPLYLRNRMTVDLELGHDRSS